MSRIVLVSNRLPMSLCHDGQWQLVPSTGGLVAALRGEHERRGSMWIGWPGDGPDDRRSRDDISAQLRAHGARPIYLTARERESFYDVFSNGVLWPLFHSQIDRLPLDAGHAWSVYRSVNLRYAQEVAACADASDLVWVHDYQLALVPQMLRALRPELRIGFFLHIPFPAPDLLRVLPWRSEILGGLLGSNLIGVHTKRDLAHFTAAVAEFIPDATVDPMRGCEDWTVALRRHEARAFVHPIGVDAAGLEERARARDVEEHAAQIRLEAQGRKILLGVDRLDYTKGIPRRLLAVDHMLDRWPELRDQIRFVQLAVPTRESVDAYGRFRRTVNELVGQINARHGTTGAVPIHLLYRSVPLPELLALYRASDVMVVTPLRDGMNLVAKEYVAARFDGAGALVLSELAGAAAQLPSALHVNPYDIHATALAMRDALLLPEEEARVRMGLMRDNVCTETAEAWAGRFIEKLEAVPRRSDDQASPVYAAIASIAAARRVQLLLDYDGTLVDFAATPDAAQPDDDLVDLLESLARLPHVEVHIVSGRTRESLDLFFGAIPLVLHAEHGAWARSPNGPWRERIRARPAWLGAVRALMAQAVRELPGSALEEKNSCLALHFRGVQPDMRGRLAKLRRQLGDLIARHPDAVVRPGEQVLEVRPAGIHKGVVVDELCATRTPAALLAAGDDLTDEDMFQALPPTAVSIHVGRPRKTAAIFHVDTPREVRVLLRRFAAQRTV